MRKKILSDQRRLSRPEHMDRRDFLKLFAKIVNLVEPEHKYNFSYPISPVQVEFSYTTSYWAKCGPRPDGAYYAINEDFMQKQQIERVLAVTTHEIAHLQYGIGSNEPTHPPEFWRAMAFYATEVRDKWDTVSSWFKKDPDKTDYIKEIVQDPNSSTVDRRMETVEERRKKMSDLLGISDTFV